MKASETKFQPIIEGTKQYVVPLFQRAYSWNKKEWEVLWDDLVYLCENDEPRSHFIGSIVTMPTFSVPEGVTKYLLIDGQQRISTIFVLLTLLRDIAKQIGEQTLAQEIEQTMLVNPFKKGSDYFKLQPTQSDRLSFQKLVNQEQGEDANLLTQCYQFFGRKFRQNQVSLQDLHKVIINRLSVVSIVLDPDDNPHLVFESLNAKGRPLTQADLIRNYFFMRIHIDQQDEVYEQYWKPLQELLGDDLTEFVRHYLMRTGSLVKQNEVYFTLKDRVGQSDALAALQDLLTFAYYYKYILEPETEQNLDIAYRLRRLGTLEVTTAYPFLLNCYHDYMEERLPLNEFIEILAIIENFILRRFVCNVATNDLNKIFPVLYQQTVLKNAGNFVDGVRQILQTRRYPRDSEFHARLIDTSFYGSGERRIKTKFILESLEASHEHKEQVVFKDLTIEHIMPQTVTEWWQKQLGADWQLDHQLCLHTLGNLTLTAYNSELSNLSYPEKKKHFVKSHIELNRYFWGYDIWTRNEIERRSAHLADQALEIWPYFGDDQVIRAESSTVTGKKPRVLEVLGQQWSVESWRDVLIKTMNTIAELEPEMFFSLAQQYPRFISEDPTRLRSTRQLDNGYYIEVNLSARDVNSFCVQAIEFIGLSEDDWKVETVEEATQGLDESVPL